MKTVAEILKVRVHSSIISVTPATTVLEAVTLMSDTDISALMVLDGEAVAGIITERGVAAASRAGLAALYSGHERH